MNNWHKQIPAESEVVSSLICNYAIETPLNITLQNGPCGYLVETTSQKYFLHEMRFTSQIRRLFYEQAFTDYLFSKDFSVRRCLRTIDQNTVVTIGTRKYYLTSYIDSPVVPSSKRKLNTEQLHAAGENLAKLHELSKGYNGPTVRRLPFVSGKVYQVLTTLRKYLLEKYPKSEFDELAKQAVEEKITCISKRPFEKQAFLDLPNIMNHGDYHAGNIVFDLSDNVIGVLDFEYCSLMPRIWDIAWAISWLSKKKFTEAFSGELDMDCIRTFVSSYHACNPLSVQEVSLLVDMYEVASYHTTWLLENLYLKEKNTGFLETCEKIEEWFWWSRNKELLANSLYEICSV